MNSNFNIIISKENKVNWTYHWENVKSIDKLMYFWFRSENIFGTILTTNKTLNEIIGVIISLRGIYSHRWIGFRQLRYYQIGRLIINFATYLQRCSPVWFEFQLEIQLRPDFFMLVEKSHFLLLRIYFVS